MNVEQAVEQLCKNDRDSVIIYVGDNPEACELMINENFGAKTIRTDDNQLVIKCTSEIENALCTEEEAPADVAAMLEQYGIHYDDFEF